MFFDDEVDKICNDIYLVGVQFRGHSLTPSQYTKIKKSWEEVRNTYAACLIRGEFKLPLEEDSTSPYDRAMDLLK